MKKINIALITLARSDYGILEDFINKIYIDKNFNETLIIGAAHLSNMFGNINDEIIKKLKNIYKIQYEYNNKIRTNNYFAKNVIQIDQIIKKKKFDCCIILGDRFEALAIALGFFNMRVPIIHLYGGSITRGSLDDNYRKCISQLASYHFVETKEHKHNLIKSNIDRNKISVLGSLSLENYKKKIISIEKLKKKLNLNFIKNKKIILCTFHPETTVNLKQNIINLKILINFLKKTKQNVLFTYPNADEGFKAYIDILEKEKRFKYFFLKKNLGREIYFSILSFADLVIGNSSSGIIETATFKIPTINVGNRQLGRIKNDNVIDAQFNIFDLTKAYRLANTRLFKDKINKIENKYYKKNPSKILINKILKIYK